MAKDHSKLSLYDFAKRYDFHNFNLTVSGAVEKIDMFSEGTVCTINKIDTMYQIIWEDGSKTCNSMNELVEFVEKEFEWSEFLLRP